MSNLCAKVNVILILLNSISYGNSSHQDAISDVSDAGLTLQVYSTSGILWRERESLKASGRRKMRLNLV
jgi:hypothetical protein